MSLEMRTVERNKSRVETLLPDADSRIVLLSSCKLVQKKWKGEQMAVRIPLTHGRFALVSDEDAEWVRQYSWHYRDNGYAARNERSGGKSRKVYLHIAIYERLHQATLSKSEMIEHRDGDLLNNQRDNLQYRTLKLRFQRRELLATNTSGYKGVSFDKSKGLWKASISESKRAKHLGYYPSPEEAARAYNKAALDYFGHLAKLNDV